MGNTNLDRALDIMNTIEAVKASRDNEARAPAPCLHKLLDYSATIEMLERSLAFELRRLKRMQQAS